MIIGVLALGIISALATGPEPNAIITLSDVFFPKERVQLRTAGLAIFGCGALCVDRSDHIYFLDPKAGQVFVFEQTGDLLSAFGRRGDGPGEFGVPIAARLSLLDDLFVMDMFRKRISIFNLEQGFRDSFLLTGTQSQVSDIRINSRGFIFVSGFTRVTPDKPEYGNWIGRYDKMGKYLGSFFPSSRYNKNWVWRILPGCLFDIDLDDNIYAIQHCEYRIDKYDDEGKLIAKFGTPPAYFISPNAKKIFSARAFGLRSQLATGLNAFARSWTRVVNILVIKNKYVLVVLEMNNLIPEIKSKYVLDIWDKDGRLVQGGICTDLRLLCKDRNDCLYFVAEDNGPDDREMDYVISKYVLRIN